MDENAIRQWLIECFGPIQGEMAWSQIANLPEPIREQLLSQDPSRLPKPAEVQSMMQAFTAGGLNTMDDMQRTVQEGPINVKLATSIALQQANGEGSDRTVADKYAKKLMTSWDKLPKLDDGKSEVFNFKVDVKHGYTYFVRVGAKVKDNLEKHNYTEIVKVEVPQ